MQFFSCTGCDLVYYYCIESNNAKANDMKVTKLTTSTKAQAEKAFEVLGGYIKLGLVSETIIEEYERHKVAFTAVMDGRSYFLVIGSKGKVYQSGF